MPSGGVYIEHRLHDFAAIEGGGPSSGLIADSENNLYGTTFFGGNSDADCQGGCGTIYELSPPAARGGAWTETTLYSFTGGLDGSGPWAGLYRDSAGNLYGTATPAEPGLWSHSMNFRVRMPTAVIPTANLILVDHIFYGTTDNGGANQEGAVFSVGP